MTEARTPTDKRIDDLRTDTRASFERLEAEMRGGFVRTDKRIDDLREDTRVGFERVDKRVDDVLLEMRDGFARADKQVDDLRVDTRAGFARVDVAFARVDDDLRELRSDFGSFQRMMIGFFATTIGSIIAGVIVLLLTHS